MSRKFRTFALLIQEDISIKKLRHNYAANFP